jgi:hypothetical protein
MSRIGSSFREKMPLSVVPFSSHVKAFLVSIPRTLAAIFNPNDVTTIVPCSLKFL